MGHNYESIHLTFIKQSCDQADPQPKKKIFVGNRTQNLWVKRYRFVIDEHIDLLF